MTWLWLVFALVAVAAIYLSWTAGRIDRLHTRVDAARASLDAQLFRRSGVALEIATSGLLDPATSLLLADAATRARSSGGGRDVAESNLSRTLKAVFESADEVRVLGERPGATDLLEELAGASRRAEMARRFHNDTVVMARGLRSRKLVRWFHLAGHAPWPETVELDTTPPEGFA